MGRKHHIEQTLLKNIEDNLPQKEGDPDVEFILLDYNSKDGLKDWVENSAALRPYLENGTLVYGRYPDADHFHHAHAKNMAHRLATGDVVCNLDADNFTGKGFARYLADAFAGGRHAVVHPAFSTHKNLPLENRGFFGRIALRRDDFLALGGYSETSFKKGWGHEDIDLLMRALAYELEPKPMFDQAFFKVVPHDDAERVKHTAGGVNEKDIEKVHARCVNFKQLRAVFNTCASSVQVNRGVAFGMGKILGLDGTARVISALQSFARVSRLGIHSLWPLMRDSTMRPPAPPAPER